MGLVSFPGQSGNESEVNPGQNSLIREMCSNTEHT